MRRLLLTFAVLSTFALTANAQDVRKFTYDVGGYAASYAQNDMFISKHTSAGVWLLPVWC